jgi:branched-chain amino acid transport system permease protein
MNGGTATDPPASPALPMTASRRRRSTLRRRPALYTSYARDMALLNTPSKRNAVLVLSVFTLALPWLVNDAVLLIFATGFAAAVGAIGLNIVTGYAGQVSLGHAFFVAVGAYTAAAVTGDVDARHIGLGAQFVVGLPAAAIAAGLAGYVVAPIAARLRGLYLAVVTLGLVLVGEHVWKEWRSLTGGLGAGRPGVVAEVGGLRLDRAGEIFGVFLTAQQKLFYLTLVVLVGCAILGRNLARGKVGRALGAIRDRDLAAEVIGIPLQRYKSIAFTVSSAYAGVAGALLYTVTRVIEPSSFNLLMSIQYIAMVLIGGVATISGAIAGALFLAFLPLLTRQAPVLFPWISRDPSLRDGAMLNVFQLEAVLYGALIVLFLVLQPRGLFGLWMKVRNYWKGWPFSY